MSAEVMGEGFTGSVDEIQQMIELKLNAMALKSETKSRFVNSRALIVPDEVSFNIERGRFVTEVRIDELVDNLGYTYSFNALDVQKLASLADAFLARN